MDTRYYRRDRGPAPLCACGCGREVPWNSVKRRYTIYIRGHSKHTQKAKSRKHGPIGKGKKKPEGKGGAKTWGTWGKAS